MEDNKRTSPSPAEIAREAFKRLALHRTAPTPDAYREIYEEIAGTADQPSAEKVLTHFASSLAEMSDEAAKLGEQCMRALEQRDWKQCGERLNELIAKHLKQTKPPGPAQAGKSPVAENAQRPLVDPVEPAPLKSSGIPLVDDPAPAATPPATSAVRMPKSFADRIESESLQARMLRDLLVRTLTLALSSLLHSAPELARESDEIAALAREAVSETALNDISTRLKQFCFRIERKSADMAEEQELLLRLFKLLLENISELLDDDSWLSGQIASVQQLLSGPLNQTALLDAMRSLKEVIYKQSMLKHSLAEAKVSMKSMMITFIDRLGTVAESTGDYHAKISGYAEKISKAQGILELNRILENVMHDTRVVQSEALRSRDEMIAARAAVQDAQARIQELESKLEQLNELVHEDQLTGSLNRRGLEEAFKREFARSERRNSPLCVALIDVDDFKRLNDTYGHTAGDEALIHLVRVMKDSLRTMDLIGRFGGEEFLIVLPDTPLEAAMQTIGRLQRQLAKRLFMHSNEGLLITFSAGVALRKPGEEQASLIQRADAALYQAKREGKNQGVAAD